MCMSILESHLSKYDIVFFCMGDECACTSIDDISTSFSYVQSLSNVHCFSYNELM